MELPLSFLKTSINKLSVEEFLTLLRTFMDDYTEKSSNMDTIVGVASMSKVLKKSPATIYRYLKNGTIPSDAAVKMGNSYYFNVRKVKEVFNLPV